MRPLLLQWSSPVPFAQSNGNGRHYLAKAQASHEDEFCCRCSLVSTTTGSVRRQEHLLHARDSTTSSVASSRRLSFHGSKSCYCSSLLKYNSTLALCPSTCPSQLNVNRTHLGLGLGSGNLVGFDTHHRGFRYSQKWPPGDSSSRVKAEGGSGDGRSWWQKFLFEPFDSNDFPDYEEDIEPGEESSEEDSGESTAEEKERDKFSWCKDDIDRMLADDEAFAAWLSRRESRNELRDSQIKGQDPDNDEWEDWLDNSWGDYKSYLGGSDSSWYSQLSSDWEKGGIPRGPPDLPERGMSRTMKELLLRIFEDEEEVKADLAFEDRVFRFTSQATVKYAAVLVFVPWLVGYISHDFVIVPFLNRYVEKVPLVAELLDLRETQKLNMVETLKMERQRVRFEAAIGKAPPLTDEELMEHIREEALELREELRLENRKAFGNIWSDILAGLTFFLLLVYNPERVAIMKLTGNRLFTNISDTGKAFLIILLSDIFLGYHSETGWETVVEIFLEHYGLEVEKSSIYIFVAIVPVTIDACFKLWVFRNLTRISPSATATFKEMKRH